MDGFRVSRDAVTGGLMTGAFATAWWALPDVVRSRPVRGLVKAGLVAASVAYEQRRAAHTPDRPDRPAAPDAHLQGVRDLTSANPVLRAEDLGLASPEPPPSRPWMGTAVLAVGAVGLTWAMERGVFVWGEKARARGDRSAHTRHGLILGVVFGALSTVATEALRRADERA
ncbi:hypothetical protein [Cellulomonas bogoriensis]|uniref:Peptidase S9 n=1 Tax=Cellulomonas bogoriensis 69B4 = DSM 16987 TaxID=1386082 RepID=A0A0A0BZG3_9CELL|nr:hypothetical protein [Cellulomonas bogoriensis]KGM13758.1 hypothetical protein N869_10420 [Cellulomonas bogoriensis 69B4 = DSM 16987]